MVINTSSTVAGDRQFSFWW